MQREQNVVQTLLQSHDLDIMNNFQYLNTPESDTHPLPSRACDYY